MKPKILLVSWNHDLWPYACQLKILAEKYDIIFADVNVSVLNELAKADIADKGQIKAVILTKAYIFGRGLKNYTDIVELAKIFIIGMVDKKEAMNYAPDVSDVVYVEENNWEELEKVLDDNII